MTFRYYILLICFVVLCGSVSCVLSRSTHKNKPNVQMLAELLPNAEPSVKTKRESVVSSSRAVVSINSVTLAWDASTNNTVVGYRIYQGGKSGVYTNFADVGNTFQTTFAGLTVGGTYYFAATAYNSTNLESDFSNEIVYTVPRKKKHVLVNVYSSTNIAGVYSLDTNFAQLDIVEPTNNKFLKFYITETNL